MLLATHLYILSQCISNSATSYEINSHTIYLVWKPEERTEQSKFLLTEDSVIQVRCNNVLTRLFFFFLQIIIYQSDSFERKIISEKLKNTKSFYLCDILASKTFKSRIAHEIFFLKLSPLSLLFTS